MPKLTNKNPKQGKCAVVRLGSKPIYLKDQQGRNAKHSTKEALAAYNRFCVGLQNSPMGYIVPAGEQNVTVKELSASFLDYEEGRTDKVTYDIFKVIINDFLLELYENMPADQFSTTCLDTVRQAMKQSKRSEPIHSADIRQEKTG